MTGTTGKRQVFGDGVAKSQRYAQRREGLQVTIHGRGGGVNGTTQTENA